MVGEHSVDLVEEAVAGEHSVVWEVEGTAAEPAGGFGLLEVFFLVVLAGTTSPGWKTSGSVR